MIVLLTSMTAIDLSRVLLPKRYLTARKWLRPETIFCPPTASPSDNEEMEEDEETPEGREYWAQMSVRTHTCRIFASNDSRLDDVDINYLSMMMVS